MEFKHVSKPKQMENECTRALQQIENEKYGYEFANTEYQLLSIIITGNHTKNLYLRFH